MKQELKAALKRAQKAHDFMDKMLATMPWKTGRDEDRFFDYMYKAYNELTGLIHDLEAVYKRLAAGDKFVVPPEFKA